MLEAAVIDGLAELLVMPAGFRLFQWVYNDPSGMGRPCPTLDVVQENLPVKRCVWCRVVVLGERVLLGRHGIPAPLMEGMLAAESVFFDLNDPLCFERLGAAINRVYEEVGRTGKWVRL